MKNRIVRTILCLLIIIAVPVALAISAFVLPPQYSETYLAALNDKLERLHNTQSPRIVVTGGSGVCFDLCSDLLEQEFPGFETVNFGLYAGLGTTVMLDLCLPQLHKGDILIFEPEVSSQTYSTFFNAEAMWQASDGHPEVLNLLPKEYRNTLLGAFTGFAAAKARLFLSGTPAQGDGIYARSSFNTFGDIACAGRERNHMTDARDENMLLSFSSELLSQEFIEKINTTAEICEKKGVMFFFRFCPMNAEAISEEEGKKLEAFSHDLEQQLHCPLLGTIEDAVMAPQWFFDTNFHLNASGAVAATFSLAEDLRKELGDPSPVTIPLPDIPPLADAVLLTGNTQDADCFVYKKQEDGFRIVSLSEKGLAAVSLTVPVSYHGEPVLGFDSKVFQGNTILEELTIQDNIQNIADSSFSGCTALKSLIMTNNKPSGCSVGRELLSGTDTLVYVPADSLSTYCTNYFWAVHAERLRAEKVITIFSGDNTEGPSPLPAVDGSGILYLANGGHLRRQEGNSVFFPMDNAHLRFNTLQGASYFIREGYVLTGWNTESDGSGERIGLGSRSARQEGLCLFAQWEKASPKDDFLYSIQNNEVSILRYLGKENRCIIPEEIEGLPVRGICAGAFSSLYFKDLIFPFNLRRIESAAFSDCYIETISLYDSLYDITDECFDNCTGLQTVHVNAAVTPVYSGSYYDTFSDKYDRLLSIRNRKKIVLASGSSGRYGYDSPMLHRAFPDYEIVNMGVYAYSNALPQMELIRKLMQKEDVLLSAPEFDAIDAQFCTTNRLDEHFWAMMESNYDIAAQLDLRNFTAVWDSFGSYQKIRSGMVGRSYSISPANYDDDGNYYTFSTYNLYGDFILPRPNGERDIVLRHNIADYTVESFPIQTVESLNHEYQRFIEDGIHVYFSYSPRNRSSLTEKSTPEARALLHQYLCDYVCIPVISEMEDYLLSGVYFWMIDSHTSTEGTALRTRQIIKDLTMYLETD